MAKNLVSILINIEKNLNIVLHVNIKVYGTRDVYVDFNKEVPVDTSIQVEVIGVVVQNGIFMRTKAITAYYI